MQNVSAIYDDAGFFNYDPQSSNLIDLRELVLEKADVVESSNLFDFTVFIHQCKLTQ